MIPQRLRRLGYELNSRHGEGGAAIVLPANVLEALSRQEHERWMADHVAAGWRYAAEHNHRLKTHPLLVAWEQLSERARETNRETVRRMGAQIDRAGLRIVPIRSV